MTSTGRLWFEELTVTPLIAQAIAELRAAIPTDLPQGAIGIEFTCHVDRYNDIIDTHRADIIYAEAPEERRKVEVSDTQQAAAWMLVTVAAYQRQHMMTTYGELNDDGDYGPTPDLQASEARFEEDVRRKLNIKIDGSLCFTEMSGSVTVYV